MNGEGSQIGELFYQAFAKKNVAELEKLYHPDMKFHDPVFGHLNRQQTLAMWQMLFTAGDDLKITFRILSTNDQHIRVEWLANYSFGKNRRPVTNRVSSELTLEEGKIIKHTDHFNLHRWASQAIGLSGLLLGWTAFFQRKLQKKTKNWLLKFMNNQD